MALIFVALLLVAISCLAGVADAAGPDRLYATGFNGSYLPPGHSNNVSTGNYLGIASLFIIDPADGGLIASVPMDEAGYFLAVSPDGARLYSTNGYSKNVTVIDLNDMTVAAYKSMNSPACGIVASPDGKKLYVALPEERTIAVMDTGTCSMEAFIPLNVSPYYLAISPDGSMLYATSRLNGTISVIEVPGNRLASTIQAGPGLSEAVLIRNHTLMVTGGDGRVYAIDVAASVVKAAIRGIIDPSYIVFDVSKNALVVTSQTDKNMTKIDASGYNITLARDFWSDYYGRPAVSGDGSRIYVPDAWGKIRVINASSLVDTGGISMAYPVTAVIYMPPQAVTTGPTPAPAPAMQTLFPSGIAGPTFYPGYGSSTPSPTPPPASSTVTQAPGQSMSIFPSREWTPPIAVKPITQSDILLVLLGIGVLLVILSGITYMLMFRGKKG